VNKYWRDGYDALTQYLQEERNAWEYCPECEELVRDEPCEECHEFRLVCGHDFHPEYIRNFLTCIDGSYRVGGCQCERD